jgi:hypothetical protein
MKKLVRNGRLRGFAALAAALLVLGGCSSSQDSPSSATAPAASPTPSGDSALSVPGGGATLGADGSAGGGQSGSGSGAGNGSGSVPGSGKKNPTPGPAPAVDLGQKTPIKVVSTLDPVCVSPGDTMSLDVTTKPKAAIVYQAVYADGYGGAPPPFGRGYGGNDKGYVSEEGTYSSTWVLSADVPSGPGRVDVIVAYGGKYGQDGPHFYVADEDGTCDQDWLNSEGDHDGKGSK